MLPKVARKDIRRRYDDEEQTPEQYERAMLKEFVRRCRPHRPVYLDADSLWDHLILALHGWLPAAAPGGGATASGGSPYVIVSAATSILTSSKAHTVSSAIA